MCYPVHQHNLRRMRMHFKKLSNTVEKHRDATIVELCLRPFFHDTYMRLHADADSPHMGCMQVLPPLTLWQRIQLRSRA